MALNVADISFDHDGRLIIDGWPLDATDRTSDPRFTDVVTLGHRNNVGIYGPTPALTHEDWSPGAGATQTDADGDFTVSVAGATQTLTIPSNYASRLQTEVPAQTAPVGVPVAYITRRADAFVGDGEDPEGVYCWLGWRYLRVLLTVPSACDVTCTVTYRELGSHNDNHLSDSTRQTEYVYTPGAQHTLVRTVAMAQGSAQPMLVDLAADTPLAIVESIELSFGATGDWSLSEPQLVLDPGDGEREAVTPHWFWKHFEHWAYAEGGISAVVDGQRCGIEWPDHNKPNTVERHLGGNFNTVIGAESGIDLTGAWPLSTYVGFIRDCADAWEVTYNTSADEAHLVDDEDERLCTLSCTDLCTVTGDDYEVTNPEVAIRVGIWTCATGLHYDWHVQAVVEGEAHGWLVAEEGGLPVRETGDFSLYRRELGSADAWVEVEELTSNGHGYWRTHSQVPVIEYDEAGAATLYEYGVGTEGAVVSLGRFAAREWAAGTGEAEVLGAPWLHWMRGGLLHIVTVVAGVVTYHWTEPFSAAPELLDTGADPFGATAGATNPFITSYGCGWLLAGATRDEGMVLARSKDLGATWEEIEGATLVSDLQNGCIAIQDGVLVACGWVDGKVVFRTTSGAGFTAEELSYGGPTEATICAATVLTSGAPPRSQVLWFGGELNALVETDTGAELYRSRDWGQTWTQITPPHIADDLRRGNAAYSTGEMVACGHDGSAVQVETAFNDARTPEAFHGGGGPTQLEVAEATTISAIEVVHGERWVATGEGTEGVTLYRMRDPVTGFAKVI